jgi:hypothetical protein
MKRLAVLLILGATILSACAGGKWTRTPVAKQNYFVVTLEQNEGKAATDQPPYKHPYMIELADLEKLMGSLTYTDQAGLTDKEKQRPVFQAVEIDRLAPVLAESLAKADASQRIRFASFNQDKGLIFSDSRKTEGVIFVDSAGRLNFAFDFINADRHPSETTAIYYTFSSVNPLKIETSKTILAPTAPYAELHQFENGRQAPTWVAIDLQKAKASIATMPAPRVKETEETAPAVAPEAATKAAPAGQPAPAQASEDVLKEDLRNNLRYLKELRDEGLISEKDYADKKRELLDKIK